MVDGTKLDGPASLRRALLARSDVFVDVASEKLLTYATGRATTAYDMPAVRSIARDAERNNYRFSSLVLGVVKSEPFQMRSREAQARLASANLKKELNRGTRTGVDKMNFITKKHLSRRTFLRGSGVTLALPFPGIHAARADSIEAARPFQNAAELHLLSARRDDGQMASGNRRRRL